MKSSTVKPNRRWLRFSLRTLFIVMTCFAILLAWHANKAARTRRVVEWVKDLGGTVHYDEQYAQENGYREMPPTRRWLMETFDYEHFTNVSRIDLRSTEVTDEDLQRMGRDLARLPKLRSMLVADTEIGNHGVAALAEITSLEYLELSNTRITDAALTDVANLSRLERLFLRDTGIGDSAIKHIVKLSRLRILNLHNTQVSDESAPYLGRIRSLETLILSGPRITDETLEHLKHLKNLKIVVLHQANVTAEGIDRLRRALPECEVDAVD